MDKQTYLFDGYNILHAEPHAKKLLGENLEEGRLFLIEKILNFLGTSHQGILVFDGPNLNFSYEKYSDQLDIYYGKTADSIIEKIAKALDKKSQITLVSSDNTVYNSILPAQGFITQLKSTDFWKTAFSAAKNFQSQKYQDNTISNALDEETRKKLDKLRKS